MTIRSINPNTSYIRETIFDNGRTVMRHLRNKARRQDTLVITFAEMMVNDPSKPGFAQDFLIKNGFDVVTVQKRSESWYQDLKISHFQRALSHASPDYSNLCCYGISMGAFASLYFGGSVDASIIAISPLCSIHPLYPKLGAHDHRKTVLATQVDLGETIIGTGPALIVYDPLSRSDQLYINAEVRPAFPRACYVLAPGTGHPSSASLKEMGLLQRTVLEAIGAGPSNQMRTAIRQSRASSPSYLVKMAEYSMRSGRVEQAMQLVEKARKAAPQNERAIERCDNLLRQIEAKAANKTASL